MKLRSAILILAGAVSLGCGNPEAARLAGIYQGRFEAEPARAGERMREEWNLRGFLQIYATGNKYKMRLESAPHAIDVEGTWSFDEAKSLLTLEVASVAIDDRGGELVRAPEVRPIDPQAIRDAYGRRFTLRLDPENNTLSGLLMRMGPITGKHVFEKGRG